MPSNGRPALLASALAPTTLTLFDDEQPSTTCPDCQDWQPLCRKMIAAHRGPDGKSRCPGSKQEITLDLNQQQWLARLHDGRAPLRASRVPPNLINLHAGERPSVVCPDCNCWRLLHQGSIAPHRDGEAPCPSSRRTVTLDLSADQWLARRAEAVRQASTRRSNRTVRRVAKGSGKVTWAAAGAPPVPPPVHRMGRSRAAA
jgi:hypothetical protein